MKGGVTGQRRTSLEDVEAEEEDDAAEVASEAGLVGAADGDDGGFAGGARVPDLHHLVAGYTHPDPDRTLAIKK